MANIKFTDADSTAKFNKATGAGTDPDPFVPHVNVDSLPALAAGTNAIGKLAANSGVDIGDVDILSIAAGDNNIGNVDIASALPAGTNAIGKLAANDGVDIGDVDVTSLDGVAAEAAALGNGILIQGDDGTDRKNIAVDATSGNVQVDVVSALPAGTNAIGKLSANSGVDIGDVDILSIAAGDNNIGNVDIASALPAGTNAIGKLAANDGVDIGDVDVTSVVPGTGATNIGKAVDSVAGATDTGVATLAIRDDALTTLTPADGDYTPLRVSSTGALHVTGGGGGTEYTVNAAAPADPTGTASLMERDDALAALSEIEGDWTNMRSTAEGALWTQDFNSDAMAADLSTLAGAVSTEMQVDVVAALPAGTNAIGKLAANSGVDIGDVDVLSIAAGENHLGDVAGNEKIIEVTMTPDTSILASGDVLADTQVVSACMRANDEFGILHSITIIDKADQAGALDIVFLSSNTSLGTENAAVSISAANAENILHIHEVVAGDYVDMINSQVASFKGLGILVEPATGTDDIYVGIVSRDTKTYTASSIVLRLGFLNN